MVSSLDRPAGQRWLLALLVAFALVAGIGLREPSPPDEPRFALAARHMVETGDWLVPRRGQEFYAEKPAVFMWLQASTYALVGDLRVAFLLPSLIGALAVLCLTWDIARRLWSRRVAWYAAGALAVCLQFGLQAKRGQIDMVLVAMTTLSLWALLRYLLLDRSRQWLWLGMFAAGVGTVTKGVGFLPILVWIPWLLVPRERRSPAAVVNTKDWIGAIAAFIAGTAVWLAPLMLTLALTRDPALMAYAQELLFKQTAQRYVDAWHHVQPWWYYIQVIAFMWLPGVLLLPWLGPAWVRRLRRPDPRLVLLLGWSALVLIFFSLSPGKREVYIFPALPAICLAAAPLLPGLLRKRVVQRTLVAYVALLSVVLAAASVSALADCSEWAQRLAAQRDIASGDVKEFLIWLLVPAATGLTALAAFGLRRVGLTLVLFTAALWTAFGFGFAPALDDSSSAKRIMQRAGEHIGPSAELGLVAWKEQNLLQADRPVQEFGFKRPKHEQWTLAAAWVRQAPGQRWLFVREDALGPCVDRASVVEIGRANRRSWVLVPGTAVASDCMTPEFSNQAAPY